MSDILEIRIIGLYILIEAIDDKMNDIGSFLGQVNDLFAELYVGADGQDDILDEVVAVVKAVLLQQFSIGVEDLYGLRMV